MSARIIPLPSVGRPMPAPPADSQVRVPFSKATPRGLYRMAGKRLLDVLFVVLIALPVLAVVLPLALIIMFDGHSPFYGQARVGRNGRVFRMWKLRTMVADADEALLDLLERDPAARSEWELHQKLRHDPRVTPVGALLRKTSLDELPQFWNVLVGDMSVVGPRPMMPSQRDLYPGEEYFALRPGITGPWQTSDRHETSFADRARFDKSYYHDLSLATDLKVMMRTVSVVINGTGC